MGLFESKESRILRESKVKAVEDEVMLKLSQCQLLDMITDNLINGEEWITTCQSYYDHCVRKVTIGEDFIEVKWFTDVQQTYVSGVSSNGTPQHSVKMVEEVHGKVAYSYTKSGYLPLHQYVSKVIENPKTGDVITVSVERVCYLWTLVVCERLQAKLPRCDFRKPFETSFEYVVPRLEWKDWF